ncbi:hypothetical protein COCVIDRAFT_30922 [Bipolaris victoriae FI3]|uniref:AttH domain-containing protein n=1 Tax=Bipolaris victoriae (strain FI3) TaxID=930091 RepID=W7E0I9_BIPV3|nr:hypothetical protein COCVIDRAFT_30922 [Bipolaris victoriae FI3]
MTAGSGEPVQSYWYASYLSGDNGHEYFSIACLSKAAKPGSTNSLVSLLDIETGEYYGRNHLVPGVISNKTYDIDSGILRQYASTADLVSVQHAESSDPHATFNLTFEPRGPNLYHGGSGVHWWGTGYTNEIAYPQLWVTGTITTNGTTVAVIPEKSLAWMDRQWGTGGAINGWWFFNFYLPNGWVIGGWRTQPVDDTPKVSSFATVLFPDGHHEVHAMDPNVHESDSWISADTNLTWYAKYQLTIPTIDLTLDVKLPHKAGEMAYLEELGAAITLFKGYATVSGTLCKENITGYGLVEQIYSLTV